MVAQSVRMAVVLELLQNLVHGRVVHIKLPRDLSNGRVMDTPLVDHGDSALVRLEH